MTLDATQIEFYEDELGFRMGADVQLYVNAASGDYANAIVAEDCVVQVAIKITCEDIVKVIASKDDVVWHAHINSIRTNASKVRAAIPRDFSTDMLKRLAERVMNKRILIGLLIISLTEPEGKDLVFWIGEEYTNMTKIIYDPYTKTCSWTK